MYTFLTEVKTSHPKDMGSHCMHLDKVAKFTGPGLPPAPAPGQNLDDTLMQTTPNPL